MKKVRKLLSMALAIMFAISVFSIRSEAAMSAAGQAHMRPLSENEVQLIYTMFKADEYTKMYPDVKEVLGTDEMTLFNHFITFGIWEQRQPCVAFNVDVYATRNPDLHKEFGDDIVAYYRYYATHLNEQSWRTTPTKYDALWHNCIIYSVYDFVEGQDGPREGAIPVQTGNYHPDVFINGEDPSEANKAFE